jgi:hypothetical protein
MLARALGGRQSVRIAVRSGGRRDPDAHQETWLIYYGDVRAGTIAIRPGNPTDTDSWWRCGF